MSYTNVTVQHRALSESSSSAPSRAPHSGSDAFTVRNRALIVADPQAWQHRCAPLPPEPDLELDGACEEKPCEEKKSVARAPWAAPPDVAQLPDDVHHLDEGRCSMNRRCRRWMRTLLPILCIFVASCASLRAPVTRSSTSEPAVPHLEFNLPMRHFEQCPLRVA
jgi:hypothetical protein